MILYYSNFFHLSTGNPTLCTNFIQKIHLYRYKITTFQYLRNSNTGISEISPPHPIFPHFRLNLCLHQLAHLCTKKNHPAEAGWFRLSKNSFWVGVCRYVGAIIDRPPKDKVFRIFRRKIIRFSPYGDRFCFSKICGRSMIAPTTTFSAQKEPPRRSGVVLKML